MSLKFRRRYYEQKEISVKKTKRNAQSKGAVGDRITHQEKKKKSVKQGLQNDSDQWREREKIFHTYDAERDTNEEELSAPPPSNTKKNTDEGEGGGGRRRRRENELGSCATQRRRENKCGWW